MSDRIHKALYGLGLISAYLLFFLAAAGKQEQVIQEKLRPEVLRFHVLAESDGARDQELKLLVRDALLEEIGPLLTGASDRDEAVRTLAGREEELSRTAERILRENGCALPVTVELAESWFPVKRYGNLVLPAGDYEALRVKIGSAGGHNWWCMLYPALCFVDGSFRVKETAESEWKEVLTKEEFEAVWQEEETKVEVRFWFWEKLQELWK